MSKSKSILLIDDDHLNNFINSKIISKFSDFTVESFTSALVALDHLANCVKENKHFPDYILLDINMPVMDGWDFLEEYEKLSGPMVENCAVVMLTSSIDIHDIEKSKQYKCVQEFASKPLTVENLKLITGKKITKSIL